MPIALITGVTGQDGSYLAERLDSEGWNVHAVVREGNQAQEQDVPDYVTVHRGDLLDPASLERAVQRSSPDAIFNLAGITSVALSWEQPAMTAQVTGVATSTMLDAAWRLQEELGRPVAFVQATSAEIFGAATQVPQNEHTEVNPVNPYGAAKAYAHHLVRVYRQRGLHASSSILYNHESPRRPTTFVTRKITASVAAIAAGRAESLTLGNLDAERDWGWAPDYVDAMMRMVAREGGDDYVVATGESHTVRAFVAAAFAAVDISDWEPLVHLDPTLLRPVDAPILRGDSSHARDTLGWVPTVTFEDLVAAMVRHDVELLAG